MPWCRKFLCLLLLCSSATVRAQTDSCTVEISLLTCAPGTDLYSLFGHTAIRVEDKKQHFDAVFNYGLFDFDAPGFYFHFTRGIMVYSVGEESFSDFMAEYRDEHRGVIAQIIQLSCADKSALIHALEINTLEKNRDYNYHFYADNCTTRAGKIIAKASSDSVQFHDILPVPRPTYRQCIHQYLDRQHQDWAKFGIDVMLGAHLDEKPSLAQEMFLPDLLLAGFDRATTKKGPLVIEKQTLLPANAAVITGSWFTPQSLCWGLFALAVLLSFIKARSTIRSLLYFDIILFAVLGIMGCIMSYVWLFRVDNVCRNNMNLLLGDPFSFGRGIFYPETITGGGAVFPGHRNHRDHPAGRLALLAPGIKYRRHSDLRTRGPAVPVNFLCMEKQISFRGQPLSYAVHGAGLPVLLLHGFTEDHIFWDEPVCFLREKYQLIVPDLPGSGHSPFNPALTSLDLQAEAVRAVLDAERIAAAVLIGHSMGGYISLSFAEQFSGMVQGIGLFHSSPFADGAEKIAVRTKSIESIRQYGSAPYISQAIPGLFAARFTSEHPEKINDWVQRYANFFGSGTHTVPGSHDGKA